MNARYVRISTENQKYERQLNKDYPDEQIYLDVCSGSYPFEKRTGGFYILGRVKNGELKYLTVKSIDRLGRNLLDILNTLQVFEENDAVIKVENLGLESMVNGKPNPSFKLIISVLANIAEMERETMLERQKEGIAIAKANGRYKGRVRGSKESKEEVISKYPKVVKQLKKGLSLRNTAKLCDVSLGTVQKVKRLL